MRRENRKKYARALPACLVVALLSGCATSSLFNPYPQQAQAFRQAESGVNTPAVLAALDARRTEKDAMLYLMERGRLAQLQGDFAGSKTDFEQVIAAFEAQGDKALISASDAGATGAALLTNDNAIPYKGSAYERVMVHQFQAFNYLGLHDIQGADVELRAAQQVQRELELKYEDEVAKAQGEAVQNKVQLSQYDQYFTGMNLAAGRVKNSFQNGYTFYTAAVIREAEGEYNDALVDYKKALELQPDNAQLQADVVRANQYFGGAPAPAAANGNGAVRKTAVAASPAPSGTVVVLFEQGFVPQKTAIGLVIPTLDGGVFSIQFPIYDGKDYTVPTPLSIRLPDNTTHQTAPLVDTAALAIKAHKEKIPGLLVRQVLRARAKYEMQKKAGDQGGLLGQFAANIYNIVSEQADLRSWLTLPANAQSARLTLPAGTQDLELGTPMGSQSVPVEVRAGRTTIVRVVEVTGRLVTQTFAL